jgi:hypothetical protein
MIKKKMCIFVIIVMTVLLISSCANNVPFTKSLIKDYKLSNADIEFLQFYLSDYLILEREIEDIDKELTNSHSLKKVEDKFVDHIVFKKGTPCIVTKATKDTFYVAFEPNENLIFCSSLTSNNTFSLQFNTQLDSRKSFKFADKRLSMQVALKGEVIYQNEIYQVFLESGTPYLMVNEKSIKDLEKKKRTVKGMKQPNS